MRRTSIKEPSFWQQDGTTADLLKLKRVCLPAFPELSCLALDQIALSIETPNFLSSLGHHLNPNLKHTYQKL